MTVKHCAEHTEHLPHCEYCVKRNRYYVCAGWPKHTRFDVDHATVCRSEHVPQPRTSALAELDRAAHA